MMTGLFARTTPEATRHDAPSETKLRYIVIVSSERPELFDDLSRRFRNSPDTTVVFDQDMVRFDPPLDFEARRSIDALLWVGGYTIVRAS